MHVESFLALQGTDVASMTEVLQHKEELKRQQQSWRTGSTMVYQIKVSCNISSNIFLNIIYLEYVNVLIYLF